MNFDDFSERSLLLSGRMAARDLPRGAPIADFRDVEFRVFSQGGEDGIIEWLVAHLPLTSQRFIEFGVQDFHEANCRFLMQNRGWKGLVLDSAPANILALQAQAMFWMHDLTAAPAFVSAENINGLITAAGFAGPAGILSIDIDGNDYWVWQAITCVDAAIVVCEFNAVFGDTRCLTVPYDPAFDRHAGHFSGQYFGASIGALRLLAAKKGYSFAGTGSNGVNAFFVRNDLAGALLPLIGEARAFASRHRDSRDGAGRLTFTGGAARFDLIAGMPGVDVESGQMLRLGDIAAPYSAGWLAQMAG